MSEWIEWNGGKCPVASDTLVEVRWRDGDVGFVSRADALCWTAGSGAFIISAYRVVEEVEPQPAVTEAAAMLHDGEAMHVGEPAQDTITATLSERGKRYGKFTGHAKITQDLKAVMHGCPKWATLAPDQKEALEMTAHKIGRILNGDPDYDDSWVDIAGYTKLVADRLQGVER